MLNWKKSARVYITTFGRRTDKENYNRIKIEVSEIVDKKLGRFRKNLVLCKLLPTEQGT